MRPEEYEVMARSEDRHWWYLGLRAMIDAAWRRHAPHGAKRLLDLGCGTGANMAHFSARTWCVGIDFEARALKLSKQRGLAPLVRAKVQSLPLRDETFDAVFLMDVLYHRAVPDKQAPLEEAFRVLRPGGLLLANVPAYSWLRSSHDAAIHADKRFTKGELDSLIRGAGFTVAQATYWNTFLFPPMALARLYRKIRPKQGSDLEGPGNALLERLFAGGLSLERRLIATAPLPFGLSIFAAARKE